MRITNTFIKLSLFSLLLVATPALALNTPPRDPGTPLPKTPGCTRLLSNFGYGTRDVTLGKDVTLLQDFLRTSGHLSSVSTGYFGPLTFAAVKKFQAQQHIISTGFVGPLTRTKIGEISCPQF